MTGNFRDRTADFLDAVAKCSKNNVQPIPEDQVGLLPKHEIITKPSQFSHNAARVSRRIFQIATNLENLSNMVKQRSLFTDQTKSINQSTHNVKTELLELSQEIDLLEAFAQEQTHKTKQSKQNSNIILLNLRERLANTTKEFGQVLNTRTNTLKEQKNRRNIFASSQVKHPKRCASSFADIMMASSPEEVNAIQEEKKAQQQELLVQQEDGYLDSRATSAEDIQEVIVELGQMYTRLSSLVSTQQELTLRIDENVENALAHVQLGHDQLVKHEKRAAGSKWLLIQIFLVLIVFSVFFVIFVA